MRVSKAVFIFLFPIIFLLLAFLWVKGSRADEAEKEIPLLLKAKKANFERYQFAVEKGAQIRATPDEESFYVIWHPEEAPSADKEKPPVLVTLHGHASWAFDEFYLWQKYAERRGLTLLAVQWWFGTGDTAEDYYTPKELYPIIATILKKEEIAQGRVMLHGFSRGAANVYALAALDRKARNNYFGFIMANAGGASPDYPPNQEISNSFLGKLVFSDTHWGLYCGTEDQNPQRDGCLAMARTSDWIKGHGGEVNLFLEDKGAGHGGFHKKQFNVYEALDTFEELLESNQPKKMRNYT